MAKRIARPKKQKPEPGKRGRATKAGKLSRIDLVGELLLEGYPRPQILRITEQRWGLSTRQTDEYIALATAEIEQANETAAERNLALVTANLWKVFRENKSFRPGVARQALMDIAKLRGLFRDELTLKIDRPLKDVSDEELEAAIAGHQEAHA